ncbi:hypothetical protein HNR32_001546 [Pectinatus brassicae]|uniref:Uncharacterized protein n=1 Tax=Pectinatus brassicae TaxID=862415 RepID=A0A840UNW7_9FIRM|nr:hypothetical protein [Pectinatus brassicae]
MFNKAVKIEKINLVSIISNIHLAKTLTEIKSHICYNHSGDFK